MTARRAPFDLGHFQYRLIRDAMNESTSLYWRRRAEQFAAAQHHPGDYPGQSTPDDLARRNEHLEEIIWACWARSSVCDLTVDETNLLLDCIAWCAHEARQTRMADAA